MNQKHSRGSRLLWLTTVGLVVSFIGVGYSALYTPEMGRRAADAIESAARTGTATAASSSASDISVSVSVPPDIVFTGGTESVETTKTSGALVRDRRSDPAASTVAPPPTRSIVPASAPPIEESFPSIPVTTPPAALADAQLGAQGRSPKKPDNTSTFLLPFGTPPPEATVARPKTNDNAPLTGAGDADQLDSRETRGMSADASGNQSGGSGQSSNSSGGPGDTAASGGTNNSDGATNTGSSADTGTGSGQSSSGASGGTQSAGNQGTGAEGGAAGAAGNAVGGAANAVGGAARGALGAVDHAAGGALGGGGGGLGKP